MHLNYIIGMKINSVAVAWSFSPQAKQCSLTMSRVLVNITGVVVDFIQLWCLIYNVYNSQYIVTNILTVSMRFWRHITLSCSDFSSLLSPVLTTFYLGFTTLTTAIIPSTCLWALQSWDGMELETCELKTIVMEYEFWDVIKFRCNVLTDIEGQRFVKMLNIHDTLVNWLW